MARKRIRKPPHRVGDGGFRREHPNFQRFSIGPEITVTVCRYAGRIVTQIKAPSDLKITVEGEIDLQKVGES